MRLRLADDALEGELCAAGGEVGVDELGPHDGLQDDGVSKLVADSKEADIRQ